MREKTLTLDSDDIGLLEELLDDRQSFVAENLKRNWKPHEKEIINKTLTKIINLRERICAQ